MYVGDDRVVVEVAMSNDRRTTLDMRRGEVAAARRAVKLQDACYVAECTATGVVHVRGDVSV